MASIGPELRQRRRVAKEMRTVILDNLYNPKFVDLQMDPDYYSEMLADICKEADCHGNVKETWADKSGRTASVWVRFERASEAGYFAGVMHKRWFAGQYVTARLSKDKA